MKVSKIIIPIILMLVLLATCTSPAGYLGVRWACNKDGGETIFSSVHTGGYFSVDHANRCLRCEYDVLSGLFDFVDADIRWSHPLTDKKGLHRYSLGELSAPECEPWRTSDKLRHVREEYAAEGKCLVLRPIREASKYSYVYRRGINARFLWTPVSLAEARITNLETSETLGMFRHYGHLSWKDGFLSEFSKFTYECEETWSDSVRIQLLEKTLRDSQHLNEE